MVTQRSAGSINALRKHLGDKYPAKKQLDPIDSQAIYCKFEADPTRECRVAIQQDSFVLKISPKIPLENNKLV